MAVAPDVWGPFLLAAVALLVLCVAVVSILPGVASQLAGGAVLRAAGTPDGYAPVPVRVDWGVARRSGPPRRGTTGADGSAR